MAIKIYFLRFLAVLQISPEYGMMVFTTAVVPVARLSL